MVDHPNGGKNSPAHTHGAIDPAILSTQKGIWAVKWSFVGLLATAVFQMVVVLLSGSVALLADTIHNVGDALTSVPLWIAFKFSLRKPNNRFTYGYGRLEDLAGAVIIFMIILSAIIAGYESIHRFFHPQGVRYLWAVIAASVIGFIGNEAAAQFRIKAGQEIGSAALVADGHHARIDGLTSLAVLLGVVGVAMGYPMADPIIGLFITVVILRIVWQSGKSILARLLDQVDPKIHDEIKQAVNLTPGLKDLSEVRIRWLGHRLQAELSIAVSPEISVEKGHQIAQEVHHRLLHQLKYLSKATIHIDPVNVSGEEYHRLDRHENDELPAHSH